MSKKNKKSKHHSHSQKKKVKNLKNWVQHIKDVFRQQQNKPLNYKQLGAAMGVRGADRDALNRTLERLEEQGVLTRSSRGKYQLADFSTEQKTGVLQGTKRGMGYVITTDAEDVFIDERHMGHALDGDTVEVTITGSRSGQPAGKIVQVLERASTRFVGIIELSDRFAFVVPSSQRIHVDLFVPKNDIKGARNGQKVVVEMIDWPEGTDNPVGKVVEVLGNPGEHDVEMHAIMAEFGLPIDFPDKVLKAADNINTDLKASDISKRRDFRKITTFTIDPDDAKDFDDALSIEFLKNGNTRVGIHIADVSHYVKPGDILDEEAIKRATSVYLVDRVVPMLPEVLSNVVCSLRPDEEKLCFSAVFELNAKANVLDEWYGRTVICSDKRFTYDTAQAVLDAKKGAYYKELDALLHLSKIMRADRVAHGAIEFGGSEVKFELDENGRPIGVKKKILKDTNRLIEDFMLLANKRVAAKIGKVDKAKVPMPFVYRVHDEPDTEKLVELKAFAQRFGYTLKPGKGKGAAFAINQLLKEVAGEPEADVIRLLAIRTMSKAYYSTDNIGHYGLSFEYYTHFTSPIRRYPDVLVHRQLQDALTGAKGLSEDELESLCRHSSMRERKATDAERASIKYKQVEFMLERVGEEFTGIISGLATWGIFVELIDNNCEGMISLNSMSDDHYNFDSEKYQIIGKRKGTTFSIGEQLTVRMVRGDLLNKQIDFEFVDFAVKEI